MESLGGKENATAAHPPLQSNTAAGAMTSPMASPGSPLAAKKSAGGGCPSPRRRALWQKNEAAPSTWALPMVGDVSMMSQSCMSLMDDSLVCLPDEQPAVPRVDTADACPSPLSAALFAGPASPATPASPSSHQAANDAAPIPAASASAAAPMTPLAFQAMPDFGADTPCTVSDSPVSNGPATTAVDDLEAYLLQDDDTEDEEEEEAVAEEAEQEEEAVVSSEATATEEHGDSSQGLAFVSLQPDLCSSAATTAPSSDAAIQPAAGSDNAFGDIPELVLRKFAPVPTLDFGSVVPGRMGQAWLCVTNPAATAVEVEVQKFPVGQGFSIAWDVCDEEKQVDGHDIAFALEAGASLVLSFSWTPETAADEYNIRHLITFFDGPCPCSRYFPFVVSAPPPTPVTLLIPALIR